ncbi:MAG: carbohydrate kinase [Pseudomonadota bacterium]
MVVEREVTDVILCGGDALIDFVPVDMETGDTAFVPKVGGAVLNVATALSRLNEDVAFIGAASEDLFGDMIIAHMEGENIDYSRVARTSDDSTLAFVTLSGGDARYAFYDQTSAGRMWGGTDERPMVDALHIGSVTLVFDPSASAYEAFARGMSEQTVVSFDPNCRPGLVKDRDSYKDRMRCLADFSHIVRYSDEDFDYLFPGESIDDVAAELLSGATKLLLNSRGADGATAYTKAGKASVNTPPVEVRDTIGAGDTFHAATLSWLSHAGKLDQQSLAEIGIDEALEMLEFATEAAALCCMMDGCNPPTRNRVVAEVLDS